MMKPAEDRPRSNLAQPLNGTAGRRILAEGEMCPDVIIIDGIGSKDRAKVLFAQDHDVVLAFSPD